MELISSHFRLQRQTVGVLAQLNEIAVANGIGTSNVGNDGSMTAQIWLTAAVLAILKVIYYSVIIIPFCIY